MCARVLIRCGRQPKTQDIPIQIRKLEIRFETEFPHGALRVRTGLIIRKKFGASLVFSPVLVAETRHTTFCASSRSAEHAMPQQLRPLDHLPSCHASISFGRCTVFLSSRARHLNGRHCA